MVDIYFFIKLTLVFSGSVILFRVIRGPDFLDRLLASNSLLSVIVLFIAVHSFSIGRYGFIDIAILYVLLSYMTSLAFAKFNSEQ